MKSRSLYTVPIFYLVVYAALIVSTGIWLFFLTQGVSDSDTVIEMIRKVASTPAEKSIHGFIEVASAHMFAIGITVFVLSHFMLFSTRISHKTSLKVFMILFIFSLLDIFSYGLISIGFLVSGWLKLFSMFMFVLFFVAMSVMVTLSL